MGKLTASRFWAEKRDFLKQLIAQLSQEFPYISLVEMM